MSNFFSDEQSIENYFNQNAPTNSKAILQIVNKKQLLNSLIFIQNIHKTTKEKFDTIFIVDNSIGLKEIELIKQIEENSYIISTKAITSIFSFISKNKSLQFDLWANGLPFYKIFAVKLVEFFDEVIYLDYDAIAIRDIFNFTEQHNSSDIIITFVDKQNKISLNCDKDQGEIAEGHFISFFKSILKKSNYNNFSQIFFKLVTQKVKSNNISVITEERYIFETIKELKLNYYVENKGYITGRYGLDLYSQEFLCNSSIDRANFSSRFALYGTLIHFGGQVKPWNSIEIQTIFPQYVEYINQIKQKIETLNISAQYKEEIYCELSSCVVPKPKYDLLFREMSLLKIYTQISYQFDCIYNSKNFYLEETNALDQIIIWSNKTNKDTRLTVSSRGIGGYNQPSSYINLTIRTYNEWGILEHNNIINFYKKLKEEIADGWLNQPSNLIICFTISLHYKDFRFIISILDKFFEENWSLLMK